MTKEGPTAFYKGWVRPTGHLWALIKTFFFFLNHCLSCSADLCHRFWGWGRGTSSCLSPLNKSREPWWSQKRRSKPKTEIPSISCLMENLKLAGWIRYIKPQLLFCHDKDIPSRVWTFLCCISLRANHFWTGKLHFNANLPFCLYWEGTVRPLVAIKRGNRSRKRFHTHDLFTDHVPFLKLLFPLHKVHTGMCIY